MRTSLLGAAAAVLTIGAVATPAMADNARVEIQGGADWNNGRDAKGTVGGAAGYDWNLKPHIFAGVEANVDKTLAHNRDATVGLTGRVGFVLDPKDKIYGLGGYQVSAGPNGAIAGGGWEHTIRGPFYGKVEYRHLFTDHRNEDSFYPDTHYHQSNQVLVGAGMHF